LHTDAEITEIIERYPIADIDHQDPYLDEWEEGYPLGSGSGDMMNPDWTPTYDLHLAAADIWDEKAANAASKFTFAADGASYNRNEVYQACKEQASIQRSQADSDSAQPRKERPSASDQAEEAFEEWESGEEI
jgi:hypothetical protein